MIVNDTARSMPALPPVPKPRPPVGSVVQAIAILRQLGSLAEGAGVTAIARATGIGPSSCFNVLRTLVNEDMVSFDPATKRYRLGLGMVDLAQQALRGNALVSSAQPLMARMAEEHDAAIGLWRLSSRGRLTLVALAESEAATRIHMAVGQRQPAAAGATGRAVIAARGLDDAAIREAFAGLRWSNPPQAEDYLREIREAERRGWAEDIGNINHGVSTVATTISDGGSDRGGDRGGALRFVLSASIFSGREDAQGLARIGADLLRQAQALQTAVYGAQAAQSSKVKMA